MDSLPIIIRIARMLADACEESRIPYAIGGAMALGYWAVPRATIDVDITIFLKATPDVLEKIFTLLESVGCSLDRSQAQRRAAEEGIFSCKYDAVRVDVFLHSIPFYEKVAKRIVTVSLGGKPATILSAEDLSVFKLLFNRGKDIEDVKRIIALQGDSFDTGYVRAELIEILGDNDERLHTLRSIIKAYGFKT